MSADAMVRCETIACPVCGGSHFTRLFEKHGEPFVRCRDCALVLINPRPVATDVLNSYDAAYTGHYLRKAAKKRTRCRRAVRRIQRHYVTSGRWLDVGCSAGFVVEAAAQAGFDAFGVDVEAAAIDHARRVLGLRQVACGTLQAQAYPAQYFDVISLYDVLEHVPDLHPFLAEVERLLAPAGVIEIRTPDVGHWRVPRRLERWPEIKPSEHLYYFDRRTLARLLAGHGLVVVSRRLAFKPGLKIYVRRAG
ncbi:MAG: methyltransferase domain-containing protein [Gammaproteobacteria bacterium]|nr:methyltransferase domain-containing protein [Gammaproteobacteria bacterium]